MVGSWAAIDHFVADRWVGPCDGINWYLADLQKRAQYLRSQEVIPVLGIPSWIGPESTSSWYGSRTPAERSACVRTAFKRFATRQGIATFDLAVRLCPAGPRRTCDATRSDGIHIDVERAPQVLDWIISQALSVARKGFGAHN